MTEAAHAPPAPTPSIQIDLEPGRGTLAVLAGSVRSLVEATVKTQVDDDTLREAARLAAEADRMLRDDLREGSPRRDPDGIRSRGLPFQYNPVLGVSNPYAPPVDLEIVDGAVHGRAVLNHAYEGPPGYVHGGILSLILDQTLGLANLVAGTPGMTLSLDVRYRRPTPLDTPLEIMSRHDRVDGRDIHCVGTISADGQVTVEAEGVFRAVPKAKSESYFKDHFRRG